MTMKSYGGNDTFDTIEECIDDANRQNKIVCGESEFVFVGENIAYKTSCDVENMLGRLEEQTYEQCGDVGYDWIAFDYKKREELKELENEVNQIVISWLKKYNRYPDFYTIQNIKKYALDSYKKEVKANG